MSCICIQNANRQLRENGHSLATVKASTSGKRKTEERVLLQTRSKDPQRGGVLVVTAQFCPFCGRKYED